MESIDLQRTSVRDQEKQFPSVYISRSRKRSSESEYSTTSRIGFQGLTTRARWLMFISAFTGLPCGTVDDSYIFHKRNLSATSYFRWKMGRMRLVVFAIYVMLYVSSLLMTNDGEQVAPVVENVRQTLFPEQEEAVDEIVTQHFTKPLQEFQPGFVAAETLTSFQSTCRDYLEATDNYVCDIVNVIITKPLKESVKGIPCHDPVFIQQALVNGDLEPYNELPRLLKSIYRRKAIPKDSRFGKQYKISIGFPLFDPLFSTTNDMKIGRLGPLPTINKKLNELARLLKSESDVFSDNPLKFEQSTVYARRPSATNRTVLRNVDRNHHWDVAFGCEPKEITVLFKIKTLHATAPFWWKIRLTWRATGQRLSFYRSALHVKTGLVLSKQEKSHSIVPLFSLLLYTLCYLIPSVVTFCMLPWNLLRLLTKRGTFKSILEDLTDPLKCRVLYSKWFKVIIENIGLLFTIIGFTVSCYLIFFPNSSTSYYNELEETKISPFSYWRQNYDYTQTFCQVLFGLWAAGHYHAVAVVFYLIRLLELSTIFVGSNFLFITLLFAFFPVVHFCAVFCFLLLSFGIILFGSFGKTYTQYSTLGRCLWNILLYTFSFGDQSKTDFLINPGIEDSAVSLQLVLLAYQILVVIVFLNMFTTIVIDAYNVACNRASSDAKMKRLHAAMWYSAKKQFGYTHELQEEIDILGGEPGPIFFRATVPDDENPLQIYKKPPDVPELVEKLETILAALRPSITEIPTLKITTQILSSDHIPDVSHPPADDLVGEKEENADIRQETESLLQFQFLRERHRPQS